MNKATGKKENMYRVHWVGFSVRCVRVLLLASLFCHRAYQRARFINIFVVRLTPRRDDSWEAEEDVLKHTPENVARLNAQNKAIKKEEGRKAGG